MDAVWLDLLDPETQRDFLSRPGRLKEVVLANPEKGVVLIDEIRKAPALRSGGPSLSEGGSLYGARLPSMGSP